MRSQIFIPRHNLIFKQTKNPHLCGQAHGLGVQAATNEINKDDIPTTVGLRSPINLYKMCAQTCYLYHNTRRNQTQGRFIVDTHATVEVR